MAGPLNGIGGGQIPLATTFQPGQQNAQVRQQDDRTPKPDQVQAKGTQPAQSQQTETRNPKDLQNLLKDLISTTEGESRRGSVVDITV